MSSLEHLVFHHSSFCPKQTSLGFSLPTPGSFVPAESDRSSGSLSGAFVRHHVEMLKEASSVEALQRKFELLFGTDGECEDDMSEDEEDIDDDKMVQSAKKCRQKYKNQKIRFDQIQRLLKSSKNPVEQTRQSSSFYSDAWPAACVLVAPALERLRQRSYELLTEFEEHPALVKVVELVRILNCCHFHLSFHILFHLLFHHLFQADIIQRLPVFHTTTMSLVNALELLLDRCERWEKFAHRGVSLKSQMSQLGQHIVLLRHQQLQDWRELRNFRESTQSREAFLWTPDVVLFLKDLVEEQEEENEISRSCCQTLWSYLEKNTLSKPIGQFDTRLQIIDVLSQLLQVSRDQYILALPPAFQSLK